MWPNLQETADFVTFTGDILNGKLHFLCSDFMMYFHIGGDYLHWFGKDILKNSKPSFSGKF